MRRKGVVASSSVQMHRSQLSTCLTCQDVTKWFVPYIAEGTRHSSICLPLDPSLLALRSPSLRDLLLDEKGLVWHAVDTARIQLKGREGGPSLAISDGSPCDGSSMAARLGLTLRGEFRRQMLARPEESSWSTIARIESRLGEEGKGALVVRSWRKDASAAVEENKRRCFACSRRGRSLSLQRRASPEASSTYLFWEHPPQMHLLSVRRV